MQSSTKDQIEKIISESMEDENKFSWAGVGGGSINETYRVSNDINEFFVKVNADAIFKNGFENEIKGLQFLTGHGAQTPKVFSHGAIENEVFLILEWIPTTGIMSDAFWEDLAQQVVQLHQSHYFKFGLAYDNHMGSIHQHNAFEKNFSSFFMKNRLLPQVSMAFDAGLLPSILLPHFDRFYQQFDSLIPREAPCAVHGDLWSGNMICSANEKGVLIDPAVYWGHREVDIAMTTLFGGFSEVFYKRYQELYPLEKGFEDRMDYFNLYPLLIHLNLFGRSYLNAVERIVSPF